MACPTVRLMPGSRRTEAGGQPVRLPRYPAPRRVPGRHRSATGARLDRPSRSSSACRCQALPWPGRTTRAARAIGRLSRPRQARRSAAQEARTPGGSRSRANRGPQGYAGSRPVRSDDLARDDRHAGRRAVPHRKVTGCPRSRQGVTPAAARSGDTHRRPARHVGKVGDPFEDAGPTSDDQDQPAFSCGRLTSRLPETSARAASDAVSATRCHTSSPASSASTSAEVGIAVEHSSLDATIAPAALANVSTRSSGRPASRPWQSAPPNPSPPPSPFSTPIFTGGTVTDSEAVSARTRPVPA